MSLVEGDVVVRAQARIGTVLRGKYRLERVLGVGGMAAVYAATHRNSKRFAIKVLHPELSLQSDVRARFQREGYAATQVNHPGAVAVLDDDVGDDGSAFLVMELLEGLSIDALWERCRWKVPAGAVLAIGHQLLDVLAAAHDNGIVHRDIKPENLFLTTDGQLKVLDFGIARLRDMANSSVTGTGFVMGTPSFMAPEQALGKSKEIDAQSDLWATGAVLFTLLSGQFVHEGESPQAIVVQCATEPARSLAEVLPDAPKEIVQLVDSALAFKKTSRWATAAAMRKGVEAAAYATLGTGPSRGPLLNLLSELPPSEADDLDSDGTRTVANARANTRSSASTSSESQDRDGSEPETSTSTNDDEPSVQRPRRVGLTTDQPVARDSPVPQSWLARHKGAWVAAMGVVALAAVGTMAARGKPSGGDAASSASGPAAAAERASTTSVPVTVPSAPAPAATPSSIAVDSLPSSPTPPTATPHAQTVAAAPSPASTHAATHANPSAAPSPAAVTPSPANCTPPFTVDPATGKKKWKAECL